MEFDFPPRTHCLSRWYYALANSFLSPKYNSLHETLLLHAFLFTLLKFQLDSIR